MWGWEWGLTLKHRDAAFGRDRRAAPEKLSDAQARQ